MLQLQRTPAFSSFAVPDIEAAKRFYGKTLGLEVKEDPKMGILDLRLQGGNHVMVYPKPDHKPAVFTILNFPVKDIGATVKDLKSAGIEMDRYALDEMKPDAQGIYRGEGPAIAWFKDPAGNILSVMETDEARN
jgi:predicted enzyme related to lactoylglutathione lyase